MDYLYFSIPCMVVIVGLDLCRRFSIVTHKSQSIAWKILLIRLVFPFVKIPSPVSIFNWISPQYEQAMIHIEYTAGETVVDPVSVAALHTMDICLVLLCVGIGISAVVFLVVVLQCARLVKNSIPCENTAGIEWAKTCPLDVQFRYSWIIRSPMSCGLLWKKYIFLPEDFVFCKETKGILEHEVFHLKAHDTLWKTLSLLMVCIHWFNPVMWMFYMYIQTEMELLCDEEVLNLHPSEYRAEYAKLLVGLSSGESPWKISVFANFKNHGFLKKRVYCIMTHKKHSTLQWCTASIACTLVVLCVSTNSVAYAGGWNTSIPEDLTNIENSYLSHNMNASGHIFQIPVLDGKALAHKINFRDMVVYNNSGLPWSFEQGQEVSLCILLEEGQSPIGQGIEFGFYCENLEETIFFSQIQVGFQISFTTPKTGNYYFYIENSSSDEFLVKSFTIK